MKTKKIFVKNRFGEKLETMIKYDSEKRKYPTIIFISGFGQDYHESNNSFDEIAKKLIKADFLTVQFSFAGRGNSEGNYREMTITRQANQVKDLFKFVKKQPNVNPKRIGIVAQSFGVPSFILALPLPVRSAVFISGVVYPFKTISSLFIKAGGFNPKGISRHTRSRGEIIKIKPQFWRSLKQHQDITTRIKLRGLIALGFLYF